MRQDKQKATELRKKGKTYSEISEILGVSRATLCDWFKDEKWSKHIKKSNIERNVKIGTDHLRKLNEGRKIKLEIQYKKTEEEAEKEFEIYKKEPFFMAGLMLYAGEGDKISNNIIRLSNSEFYIHLIFIRFSEKYLNVKQEKIKFWLLLYPDHDIETCINTWVEKIKISKSNFYKTQIIQGKPTKRKLQYGVGNSIISETNTKKKLMKWLELCKLNLY